MREWELSDENNKVSSRHFSRTTTDYMTSFIKLAISDNPESIVLHYGTNDLRKA